MPTLYRARHWKITVYADDHHPPHFHVQTPDGESLVDLATLREMRVGADRRALREALVWARANRDLVFRVWMSLNERSEP